MNLKKNREVLITIFMMVAAIMFALFLTIKPNINKANENFTTSDVYSCVYEETTLI